MPFCYDGVNDMFESATWDLEAYTEQCQELWGEGIDMKRDFQNFHTNFGLEFGNNRIPACVYPLHLIVDPVTIVFLKTHFSFLFRSCSPT